MLNDSHRKGRNSMPSEKRQTLRLEIPTLQILCALLWSTSPNQTHTTNTTILAAQGHTLLELLICFFLQTVLPDIFQNEDLSATAQWSSCTPCTSKNITWCKTAQNKVLQKKEVELNSVRPRSHKQDISGGKRPEKKFIFLVFMIYLPKNVRFQYSCDTLSPKQLGFVSHWPGRKSCKWQKFKQRLRFTPFWGLWIGQMFFALCL